MRKKQSCKKNTSKIQNTNPTDSKKLESNLPTMPIVGIGASAGGLDAFERFFTHISPETGMAFVIVQHLEPTHKSILTDLLKKYTKMPVVQVKDGITIEPNTVYVIPPNRDMTLQSNHLCLMEPAKPRGLRLPIDSFFRSLAVNQRELGICIVLSGTGSDGTLGLKAIKEEGGLTIVQLPSSALYDGMPISAINTGLVDVILPPEKIAEQLVDYVKRSFGGESKPPQELIFDVSSHLQKIFVLLREHTGHDFSGYKENTISRRIERRITVNQLGSINDYLDFLRNNPLEIQTLFRELLIGVTNFFRDPEAFEQLEKKAIAPLVSRPGGINQPIRIWIPGCSTGEEAYSIAMLFLEQKEKTGKEVGIQIYATDIDTLAIEKAREGRYPDSIAADVSPERLQKFFIAEPEGNNYRIRNEIREMVVFAVQSVVKDPPFSKLDLICCRNLMIYIGAEVQQKILAMFHYALNPDGYLFLGNSESLGAAHAFFRTIDTKWKVFQRIETLTNSKTFLEFPSNLLKRRVPASKLIPTNKQMSMKEMTESLLLAEHTPICAVINEKGEVLYVHGRTGKFFEQTTGELSTNILQMARDGLKIPLATAIRKVNLEKTSYQSDELSVNADGNTIRTSLAVDPILKPESMHGLMLVTFKELPKLSSDNGVTEKMDMESMNAQRVLELEDELKSTREYLQSTIEELETTNEELKSAIEELQSSNEELQSTNEELVTSKEELQSVNEELMSVNVELQRNVADLTIANNDIKNLLDNVQTGVIFLDMNLRIRRFTPSAEEVVDLIQADIGRPLAQFSHKLQHGSLIKDSREVLDTLTPKETEAQSHAGNWYLIRIMPYYTVDDQVDGVVLAFTDITQIKNTEMKLLQTNEMLTFSQQKAGAGLWSWDIKSNELTWTNELFHLFGLNKNEVDASFETWRKITHPDDYQNAETNIENSLSNRKPLYNEYRIITPSGETRWIGSWGDAIYDEHKQASRMAGLCIDITSRKQAEENLRQNEERLSFHADNSPLGVIEWNKDFVITRWSGESEKIFGWSASEAIKKPIADLNLFFEQGISILKEAMKELASGDSKFVISNNRNSTKDGQTIYCEWYISILSDNQGNTLSVMSQILNITEKKHAEEKVKSIAKFPSENPAPVIRISKNGNLKYINESGINLFPDWNIPIGKPAPPVLQKIVLKALETEKAQVIELCSNNRQFSFSVSPIVSGDYANLYGTDITKRKKTENSLRETKERFRRLVENAPDIVYTFSNKRGLIYASPRVEEMIGYTPEYLYEHPFLWNESIHQDDLPKIQEVMDNLDKEKAFNLEYRFKNSKGNWIWFRNRAIKSEIDNGEFLIEGLANDITEYKKAQEDKIVFEKMLQQAQRLESLGVLAGGIAHDFNNLLTIVQCNCSLLELQPENTAEIRKNIEKAVRRGAELCAQMLAYAGKSPIMKAMVDVKFLVRDILFILKATISQNVVFNFECITDIPLIESDASQIKQILMNLIINAAEAIGEKKGTVNIILSTATIDENIPEIDYFGAPIIPGSYICLEVKDDGCGMDDDTAKRIFEPFFSTKFTGRGLGLSAIMGIIASQKGGLQISSQPMIGTTFRVFLPASVSENEKIQSERKQMPTNWKKDSVILLVEDETALIDLAASLCKALGFSTLKASNGVEAINIYKERKAEISLVILDIGMPLMDGYELFQELKKLNSEIPIIVSSGFSNTEIVAKLNPNEVAGFIEKPFNFLKFETVIKNALKE